LGYHCGYGIDTINNLHNYNTGLGYHVFSKSTGGSKNVAIGIHVLRINETGDDNTAVGNNAMYKNDNTLDLPSDKEYIGLVAQVVPEAVDKMESGYLSVNNDPIIWTMLNAIKEQQKIIESLEQRIKVLENQKNPAVRDLQ